MKELNKNVRCSAISAEESFNAYGGMSEVPVNFRTFTEFRSLSVLLVVIKRKQKISVVFEIDT